MIELDVAKRAGPFLFNLQEAGFDLVAPDNFAAIEPMVRAMGNSGQAPMLSVTRNDFTRGDAFFLFLTEGSTYVGSVAARFLDLRDEDFGSFLRRTSKAQYDRELDPIVSIAPPVRREISGKLIFLGELKVLAEHREKRDVLVSFMRMSQALAAMKWPDFDWIYAFIPQDHMDMTDDYGFTWKMPRAITWRDPVPEGRSNDHWLVAVPRPHFTHLWGFR